MKKDAPTGAFFVRARGRAMRDFGRWDARRRSTLILRGRIAFTLGYMTCLADETMLYLVSAFNLC